VALTISTPDGGIVVPGITAWSLDYAYGKAGVCPADGTFATHAVRALCRTIRRQPQGPELHVHGSVPVRGVCAADVSRESAGYRGVRSQTEKLYHLGIRGQVSRNTLANANATRD
jgi:hypothetical protein